ncbi:chymotrypsin-2-like [Sitodiplosis mosellana]|uniref:chymotrypsin-2-like n=1 Tax=Sitodiplosis mosellana TaxID=263140 RepID=UPI0024440AD7|nr:chymotrypsin-2-like [Sitodiplosis mosellana]
MIFTFDLTNETSFPGYAGAIISENFILTSASCAYYCRQSSESECFVFVGRVDGDFGGQSVDLLNTIWHESWEEDSRFDRIDIGILMVSTIEFSESVHAIALPQQELTGETEVTITGWGKYGILDSPFPLQHANVMAVSCNHSEQYRVKLACTTSDIAFACNDDGAPLVYTDRDELIGIGSVYTRVCQPEGSQYVRVYPYLEWIDSHINASGNSTNASNSINDKDRGLSTHEAGDGMVIVMIGLQTVLIRIMTLIYS